MTRANAWTDGVPPPPSSQVSDAASEIQRVDREIAEIDEEISQLKMRRAHDAATPQQPTLTVDSPDEVAERILRENLAKSALGGATPDAASAVASVLPSPLPLVEPARPPGVEVVDVDAEVESALLAKQANQPNTYACFRATAARHEVVKDAVRAEVRRRKLQAYYRMRMTGEAMAKDIEASVDLAAQQSALGQPVTVQRLLVPGGMYRLQHGWRKQESTGRWDSSLAPEVDMEWDRDVFNHVFDDQTQRVHDPEAENRERRAHLRWTPEEQDAFVEAYRDYGKEFHVVATKKPFRVSEVAPKSTHDIIAFYYHIKVKY